ncbi:multisubunit sodium/proton antiporter, MrpF subunit [Halobacillus karajensis]|uniref:Multiple resistance and pH homeostasis protein F n=1 Tax=Halobacillus karajensis TaxID=195088 RepID=A0A024P6L6_9BACI|nr:Na(+)/H(+) antiporter subunit F1 [Halobacillus karajensis]CDQ18077.1 Multiple resistance and pH homeostasis protein F [Halobacillus karajensis]CDQ24428.1 Multiple resistance and pH homeostasis protein F [Halobacillus karajensis]CDQ29324.1 Multiple resistance and pH homeostasis protein F [Halobacillus karajensis]SEH59712.1 multisubunit sodium/proton antiporter, MrpF subunit [Halobacillus karajensis]
MESILDITQTLIQISATIAVIAVAISVIILLYRAILGPTNPDRAVALDIIGINLMALAGLIAVLLVTTRFNDVVLLIGILLFIGTVALAKFLEKGVIIERDMD